MRSPIRLLVPLLAVLAAASALAATADEPPDPAGFLPRAEDLAGWSPVGDVQRYPAGKLHRYLDGGADVLEEYGLELAVVREWSRDGATIAVQVYRMKDGEGACGILTAVRGRGSRRLEAGDGGFENDLRAACWKGRWFLQIDIQEGGKTLGREIVALLRTLSGRVPGEAGEPALLAVLRTPTMVPGTEVLLRGPLALKNAGFPGDLAVEGFTLAATASYGPVQRSITLQQAACLLLLADYATDDAAAAAMDVLRKEWKIEGRAAILAARVGSENVLAWRDGRRVRIIVR